MIGKSDAPRWVYDFNCDNCSLLQFVNDPAKKRYGMYCRPTIEAEDRVGVGKGADITIIHADDDRHLRCDFYSRPHNDQITLFTEETA